MVSDVGMFCKKEFFNIFVSVKRDDFCAIGEFAFVKRGLEKLSLTVLADMLRERIFLTQQTFHVLSLVHL